MKLIQDLRGLVKVFSILASTESFSSNPCFLMRQWSVNYAFFRHNRKPGK